MGVLHSLKERMSKSKVNAAELGNHWTPSTPPPPPAFATPVLLLASDLRDYTFLWSYNFPLHSRSWTALDKVLSCSILIPSTFLHVSRVARIHAFLYTASIWYSPSSHRRTFSRAASTDPRSDQLSQPAVLRLCTSSNLSLGTSTNAINPWSLII